MGMVCGLFGAYEYWGPRLRLRWLSYRSSVLDGVWSFDLFTDYSSYRAVKFEPKRFTRTAEKNY